MIISILELADDKESLDEIARIRDGDIQYGGDAIRGVIFEDELDDPRFLLDHFNGPRVFAERVPEEGDEVGKEWVPYDGPQGGKGWKHEESGEVRYQDDKPQDRSVGDEISEVPESERQDTPGNDVGTDADTSGFVGGMETVNPTNVNAGQYAVLNMGTDRQLAFITNARENDGGETEYSYRTSDSQVGTFTDTASVDGVVPASEGKKHFDAYSELSASQRLDTTVDPSNLQRGDTILVDQGQSNAVATVTSVEPTTAPNDDQLVVDFERNEGGGWGMFYAEDDADTFLGRVYGKQYSRGLTPHRKAQADDEVAGIGVATLPNPVRDREVNTRGARDQYRPGDTILYDDGSGNTKKGRLADIESTGRNYSAHIYNRQGRIDTIETHEQGEKIHGRVVSGDETLGTPDSDFVSNAASQIIHSLERRERKNRLRRKGGEYLGNMIRMGANPSDVIDGLESIRDRSNVWGEDDSGRFLVHEMASGAWERLSKVDSEYGSVSLGDSERSVTREFDSAVEDELGRDENKAVTDAYYAWVHGDSLFDRETAPMWQLGEEKSGNTFASKNSDELFGAELTTEEQDGVKKHTEEVEDYLRETYGDTVPVFKGVGGRSRRLNRMAEIIEDDEPVTLRHMTLESWAFDPDSALSFAYGDDGVVVRREMPVEKILGTSQTNPDLYKYENEAVCATEETHTYDPEDVIFPHRDQQNDIEQVVNQVQWAYDGLKRKGILKAEKRDRDAEPEYRKPAVFDLAAESAGWLHRLYRNRRSKEEGVEGGVRENEALTESFDVERAREQERERQTEFEVTKAFDEDDFEQLDNHLLKTFADQVCVDDVSKAPTSWKESDNVPGYVRKYVGEVATKSTFHDDYENIPHAAALEVHRILRDALTDSGGWSVGEITDEITDEFDGVSNPQAQTMVLTEVSGVLNTAREKAFEQYGEDPEVLWTGPDDAHTTDLCTAVKARIENAGGYVELSELKDILVDEARKHLDEGGLPGRARDFVPHYNCRHTFTRKEFRWMDI